MITQKMLQQYKEYGGDLDAWSRKHRHEENRYDDWILIQSLVQNIWLIKNNKAGEELIRQTKYLIRENLEDASAIELLYKLTL